MPPLRGCGVQCLYSVPVVSLCMGRTTVRLNIILRLIEIRRVEVFFSFHMLVIIIMLQPLW